jgi:serine/threonine protein kinase
MALTSGTKLGPYEILSPAGVGGMGEVYRADDLKLGQAVALKSLPRFLAQDPALLAPAQIPSCRPFGQVNVARCCAPVTPVTTVAPNVHKCRL